MFVFVLKVMCRNGIFLRQLAQPFYNARRKVKVRNFLLENYKTYLLQIILQISSQLKAKFGLGLARLEYFLHPLLDNQNYQRVPF